MTDLPLTLVDLTYDKPDYNCDGFVGRDSDFVVKKTEKDHELEEQKQQENAELEANRVEEEQLIQRLNMIDAEITSADIFAETDSEGNDENSGLIDDTAFDSDKLNDEQSDADGGWDDIIDVREVTEDNEETAAESDPSAADPDDFTGEGDKMDDANYNFDRLL